MPTAPPSFALSVCFFRNNEEERQGLFKEKPLRPKTFIKRKREPKNRLLRFSYKKRFSTPLSGRHKATRKQTCRKNTDRVFSTGYSEGVGEKHTTMAPLRARSKQGEAHRSRPPDDVVFYGEGVGEEQRSIAPLLARRRKRKEYAYGRTHLHPRATCRH